MRAKPDLDRARLLLGDSALYEVDPSVPLSGEFPKFLCSEAVGNGILLLGRFNQPPEGYDMFFGLLWA